MEDKDDIRDLFNNKLKEFEAPVRPELWSNIASQIGATTSSVAAAGLSVFTKTIIAISVAATLIGISMFTIKYLSKDKASSIFSKTQALKNNLTNKQETKISDKQLNKKIVYQKLTVENELDKKEITKVKKSWIPSIDNFESPVKKPEDKVLLVNNKNENTNQFINNPEGPAETPASDKAIVESAINTESPTNIEEPSIIAEDLSSIKMNNIFTPNGDGANDFLTVLSAGLTDFSVVVLNENSKIVFQSNEIDFSWNGYGLDGEVVPTGNYIYYVTARNQDGKLISKHSMLRIESNRK